MKGQSADSLLTIGGSEARFLEHTHSIVGIMLAYDVGELSEIFRVSLPIARGLKERFGEFVSLGDEGLIRAIDSYDGVVYKHIKGDDGITDEQISYLQQHLRISSLLWGFLRPMDLIRPYRMEGFVRLAGSDQRVDRYWQDIQTQTLIDDVQKEGGTLLYLASKEEQNAFNWREVKKSVRVIDFLFMQRKGDKLRQVVIYTKMARGEMVRYMMHNSITDPEELKAFEWQGYRFSPEDSSEDSWVWVMD